MARKQVQLGSVSTATLRPQDLIEAFADTLRALRGALPREVSSLLRAYRAGKCDEVGEATLLEDLTLALEAYAPDYCYFGAHPDDGADFGFWLSDDWQQMARDDGVPFVADTGDAPADAPVVAQVSDHGNVTLYARTRAGTLREIWSVV